MDRAAYLDDGDQRLYHGDCVTVIPTLGPVDAIVTDPPYGIAFMGKEWDSLGFRKEFHQAWAGVALVALRPGGHLVAFGGTRTYHRLTCALEDAGFEIRDCLMWMYGSGFPKSLNVSEGRGTALKPAWEPIVLARKPLAGTVAANVLEHGTGALNIDACRIAGDVPSTTHGATNGDHIGQLKGRPLSEFTPNTAGRWPANVVLDAAAAAILDEQSGETSHNAPATWRSNGVGGYHGVGEHEVGDIRSGFGDRGGASRFFYTAKASRSERNDGTDGQNHHPTVKPVSLMRWLVRLVAPPGGVVLDPFVGSGSTLLACRAEGVRGIGIDREEDYLKIAAGRLSQLSLLGDEMAARQ